MDLKYSKLLSHLDYQFGDQKLLSQALTHRSFGSGNNERMEFLGDAILGFAIADWLYQNFPLLAEGEMTRLRSSLVKKETLADIARSINLGAFLSLGSGELKSGGARRDSILSDALEAIFCSVYMDSGIDASRRVILHLYDDRLKKLNVGGILKDPKSRLQELLQSQNLELPTYALTKVDEQGSDPFFQVECRVPGMKQLAVGSGSSRKKAEQEAASIALNELETR